MKRQEARPAATGLFLSGTVRERSRRTVKAGESTAEVVTYLVVDGNGKKHFVDDYAPDRYL